MDSLLLLNIIANVAQLLDYNMNLSQLSNDDIMRHLQQQDKLLNKEINQYLKEIIKQNDLIIKLLNTTNDGCGGNDCDNADNTI